MLHRIYKIVQVNRQSRQDRQIRQGRQDRQSRQSRHAIVLLQEWVNTMAAYVKSLDSNHLLTVGEEGFYPSGGANPSGNQTYVAVIHSNTQ